METIAHPNQTAKPNLRNDIARLVARSILTSPKPTDPRVWLAYRHFKLELTTLCGDYAPTHRRDQEQFDAAVSRFVAEVGL